MNRGIVVQSGRLCQFPRRGYGSYWHQRQFDFFPASVCRFFETQLPLVSDYPDLKTIDTYGVLDRERRLAQRSYFIVDKQGIIRYKNIIKRGQPLVDNDALVAEIKKIP